MLTIEKGQTKYIYATLAEKTTISSPTYLFSVTHIQTEIEYNTILNDVSTFSERYNKFQIIEGVTQNFKIGEYAYTFYAQTSTSNLNPSLANEIVETGIFQVDPNSVSEIFYNPN